MRSISKGAGGKDMLGMTRLRVILTAFRCTARNASWSVVAQKDDACP